MIKRYKMGRVALGNTGNGTLTGAGIVENTAGEFVRYEDVTHLLEEKTPEQHRAEFDKFATSHGLSVSKTDTDLHISHTVGWMWQAWKAAKGVTE